MRLLKRNNTGEFGLTEDFVGEDIPRYARIHGELRAAVEEVSFKDMMHMDGTGKSKPGYDKIWFCGEQARRDGLQYFWIDTCCIDKSSSTELHEAINSVFLWYRNAAKCYVGVWRPALDADEKPGQLPWESSFRKSRSLERHIREVTGIPVKALRGSPLSDFSVPERMLWAENRIFDFYIPLIYGEGEREGIQAAPGTKRGDFSVAFSLSDVPEIEIFVAREEELAATAPVAL
ncbi:hypothetical protein V8E54_000096 [Elaphomyces granulatus]